VVANAQALGVALSAKDWQRLDDDQRYALIKLGDVEQPGHNFRPALAEFLSDNGSTVSV
jgi:Conserved nitrate reductase-associated protein (Nitr_red_assoc)